MDHKNLEAWKEATKFITEIYRITQNFPQHELYGLTNQIRRSAVSIPANISEGCARQSDKETIQFLYISIGSIAELETELLIAQNLGYTSNIDEIMEKLIKIRSLVLGLIKYLKNKVTSPFTLHTSLNLNNKVNKLC